MRRSLLWLGILGGAIPALAQNQVSTDPGSVSNELAAPTAVVSAAPTVQAAAVKDHLLVTGALADESDRRLPISADVIDRAEIEARQSTAVAELLRTVPGLDVVRSGSAGKATSLFTRGTESDHTLVLWNGIELNNPFFGGFDWGLLATDGVDRVEVVRGPFSALYGSEAVGGVVQVLTGGREPTRRVGLEAGEGGYQRATAAVGFEAGRARLDATAHRQRSDGPVANDFYDSDEVTARLRWRLGDGGELGVIVRGNDSGLGIPFSGGFPTPQRTTQWRESQIAVPVRFDRGKWTFDGRLTRVSLESDFADPDDPFGFTSSYSDSTSERGRGVATRRFDDNLWVAFGAELEEQTVDGGSAFGVDLSGESQTTEALFGQLFVASGKLSADLGVRHDNHDVFGNTTSPKAGIALQVGRRGRLHMAYGEGFRAPSLGELFFPFSGNRDLQPEESVSYELGYERSAASWSMSINAFRNELENLIDFDFVDFRNVNVGRALTEGAELAAGWHWRGGSLRGTATYLEAEDLASGLALLRRPEWRGSLVGMRQSRRWTLSATVIHTGARDDVDPLTFERRRNQAYERLDVAARYQGWRGWVPYARVENVTDEEYAEALGFPAPGRQWVGGLSLEF